jgi:sulfiredoxin
VAVDRAAIERTEGQYRLARMLDIITGRAFVQRGVRSMMKSEKLAIANIYVPVKRRATLKPETVREIAQSMLEVGQTTPILIRRDGERFVLVHGLHRLEACKALGEDSILGYLVQARTR